MLKEIVNFPKLSNSANREMVLIPKRENGNAILGSELVKSGSQMISLFRRDFELSSKVPSDGESYFDRSERYNVHFSDGSESNKNVYKNECCGK